MSKDILTKINEVMKGKKANYQGFEVKIDSLLVHFTRSKEEYGEHSAKYSNSFEYIKLDDNANDLLSALNFKVGDTVYVVWAEYSYGDSFGTNYAGGTEPLAVFKDRDVAKKFVSLVEKNKEKEEHYKIHTDDGQNITVYTPWTGYFNSLVGINIDTAILK